MKTITENREQLLTFQCIHNSGLLPTPYQISATDKSSVFSSKRISGSWYFPSGSHLLCSAHDQGLSPGPRADSFLCIFRHHKGKELVSTKDCQVGWWLSVWPWFTQDKFPGISKLSITISSGCYAPHWQHRKAANKVKGRNNFILTKRLESAL